MTFFSLLESLESFDSFSDLSIFASIKHYISTNSKLEQLLHITLDIASLHNLAWAHATVHKHDSKSLQYTPTSSQLHQRIHFLKISCLDLRSSKPVPPKKTHPQYNFLYTSRLLQASHMVIPHWAPGPSRQSVLGHLPTFPLPETAGQQHPAGGHPFGHHGFVMGLLPKKN